MRAARRADRASAAAATRSAWSQPASISRRGQVWSAPSALSHAERIALKIGVSASPRPRCGATMACSGDQRARAHSIEATCDSRSPGCVVGRFRSTSTVAACGRPSRRRRRAGVAALLGSRSGSARGLGLRVHRHRLRPAHGRRRLGAVAAETRCGRRRWPIARHPHGSVDPRCKARRARRVLRSALATGGCGMAVRRPGAGRPSRRAGVGEDRARQQHRRGGAASLVALQGAVSPCRWASRLTTNRPIRRAVSGVTSPPECRVWLISASASAGMPRPPSAISIRTPSADASSADQDVVVGGGVGQGVVDELGEQVHDVGRPPSAGCGASLMVPTRTRW